LGTHEFTASSISRLVTGLQQTASPSIIASAGETIKNSLSYNFIHDKRNDQTLPSEGYMIKTSSEFAGFGGNVKFLKATIEGQYIKTFSKLWPRVHFVSGARGGILWSLDSGFRSHVTDRFYLGGPTDVRGFREFGLGPKDGSNIPLNCTLFLERC